MKKEAVSCILDTDAAEPFLKLMFQKRSIPQVYLASGVLCLGEAHWKTPAACRMQPPYVTVKGDRWSFISHP